MPLSTEDDVIVEAWILSVVRMGLTKGLRMVGVKKEAADLKSIAQGRGVKVCIYAKKIISMGFCRILEHYCRILSLG